MHFREWETSIKSTDPAERGNIDWNECLQRDGDRNLKLLRTASGESIDDYPHIFVHLLKILRPRSPRGGRQGRYGGYPPESVNANENTKSVPFAYFKVELKHLVDQKWKMTPQWIILREDRCFKHFPPGSPLPSLLLSLRGGTINSFQGIISPVNRPFTAIKTKGTISLKILCDEINKSLDRVRVYWNKEMVSDQKNGEEILSIRWEHESVSVYDRITIHRSSSKQKGTVFGEITFQISDLLEYSKDDPESDYEFESQFTTNPPTISMAQNENEEKVENAPTEVKRAVSNLLQ